MDDVLAGGPRRPPGRTRRLLPALTAVALLLAAVAVTRHDTDAVADAPAAADAGTDHGGVPGVLDGPPRGSLAADRSLLADLRGLDWAPEGVTGTPDPAPRTRRVVFAGDVPGGRWALVVGDHDVVIEGRDGPELVTERLHRLAAAWFTGPPGAGAAEMRLRSLPAPVVPGEPVALVDPGAGTLVVVAARGAVVEVSGRPEILPDAGIGRAWAQVPTEEGVAVVSLRPLGTASPTGSPTAVRYRVAGPGGAVTSTAPPAALDPRTDLAPLPVGFPRGAPSGAGEAVARRTAARVVAATGLAPADVRITARWVGELVPAGPTAGTHAALVAVTVPSGAVVVSAGWSSPEDGPLAAGSCGSAVEPAGPPVADRVHAVACEAVAETPSSTRSTLVVVGPPSVAAVRTYGSDGGWLGEHPATGGVVVVPLPPGTATVEAVTGAGVLLGRTAPIDGRTDLDG